MPNSPALSTPPPTPLMQILPTDNREEEVGNTIPKFPSSKSNQAPVSNTHHHRDVFFVSPHLPFCDSLSYFLSLLRFVLLSPPSDSLTTAWLVNESAICMHCVSLVVMQTISLSGAADKMYLNTFRGVFFLLQNKSDSHFQRLRGTRPRRTFGSLFKTRGLIKMCNYAAAFGLFLSLQPLSSSALRPGDHQNWRGRLLMPVERAPFMWLWLSDG